MGLTTSEWRELLEELGRPFAEKHIQWRAGATTKDKGKAQALPYAEPRVYEDRLNRLCPGDWSVLFKPWGESKVICELTIHGVTRASTGESDGEGFSVGTAAEAQAFKRACSKFGLGRYLYDITAPWVKYDAQKRKLLETPNLPNAPRQPKYQAPRQELQKAKPAGVSVEQRLSPERAHVMHAELGKLGCNAKNNAHYKLASYVVGREITSLTELTEREAAQVYGEARRRGQVSQCSNPKLDVQKRLAELPYMADCQEVLDLASEVVNRKITSFSELQAGEIEDVEQYIGYVHDRRQEAFGGDEERPDAANSESWGLADSPFA